MNDNSIQLKTWRPVENVLIQLSATASYSKPPNCFLLASKRGKIVSKDIWANADKPYTETASKRSRFLKTDQ